MRANISARAAFFSSLQSRLLALEPRSRARMLKRHSLGKVSRCRHLPLGFTQPETEVVSLESGIFSSGNDRELHSSATAVARSLLPVSASLVHSLSFSFALSLSSLALHRSAGDVPRGVWREAAQPEWGCGGKGRKRHALGDRCSLVLQTRAETALAGRRAANSRQRARLTQGHKRRVDRSGSQQHSGTRRAASPLPSSPRCLSVRAVCFISFAVLPSLLLRPHPRSDRWTLGMMTHPWPCRQSC